MATIQHIPARGEPRVRAIGSSGRVLAVMAFSLGFMNGSPLWLSNGVVCLVGAMMVWWHALRATRTLRTPEVSADLPGLGLVALAIAACVSTLANPSSDAVLDLTFGFLIPPVVCLAARRAAIDPRDVGLIALGLALGLLLRFSFALLVFVQEFGLPSEVLSVFFMRDLVQVSPYVDATFGNTGNTASLIAIGSAFLLFALATLRLGGFAKALIATTLLVLMANALITGSRGVLVFTVLSLILVLIRNSAKRWLVLAALALVGAMSTLGIDEEELRTLETLYEHLTFTAGADESANERLQSVQIGLDTLLNNPLGVGPGRSVEFNTFSVPHQFALNQASDIGWVALPIWLVLFVHAGARFATEIRNHLTRRAGPSAVFALTAFVWLLYAMTLNIATTLGTCISWIGLFALSAGLSNNPALRGESRTRPEA